MNKKSDVISKTQITSVTMQEQQFIGDLKHIVQTARNHSYRAANLMQVASNWLIGWRIVEQEKQGKQKADYGTYIVRLAAEGLTREFGSGYSQTNVKNFVRFYNTFRQFAIGQTLPDLSQTSLQQIGQTMPDLSLILQIQKQLPIQLSWSHYERLIRVTDHDARLWYMNEAATQQWDYRTLRRNISSQYYYRLIQTPEAYRPQVEQEMQQLTSAYQQPQSAFIKNPMLVEFLGFSQGDVFTEATLEDSILNHIQRFLMEMGKGYAFVARQQHIHTEDDDYYIDLVFYNYLLKCFVLIDLKTTRISYEDVGQMDMYLQMYDDHKRSEGDNLTIGIILCADTNADVARYSSLAKNKQLYASKYLTYMPSTEELRQEIERQKEIYRLSRPDDSPELMPD